MSLLGFVITATTPFPPSGIDREAGRSAEAHLVAWLSKRLRAPLVIPHLGDGGWNLLGGRLLPATGHPIAQFHRRLDR